MAMSPHAGCAVWVVQVVDLIGIDLQNRVLPIEWGNSARCIACEVPVLPAAQVVELLSFGRLIPLWCVQKR